MNAWTCAKLAGLLCYMKRGTEYPWVPFLEYCFLSVNSLGLLFVTTIDSTRRMLVVGAANRSELNQQCWFVIVVYQHIPTEPACIPTATVYTSFKMPFKKHTLRCNVSARRLAAAHAPKQKKTSSQVNKRGKRLQLTNCAFWHVSAIAWCWQTHSATVQLAYLQRDGRRPYTCRELSLRTWLFGNPERKLIIKFRRPAAHINTCSVNQIGE